MSYAGETEVDRLMYFGQAVDGISIRLNSVCLIGSHLSYIRKLFRFSNCYLNESCGDARLR